MPKALTNINLDGSWIEAGSDLSDLTDEQLEQLRKDGAVLEDDEEIPDGVVATGSTSADLHLASDEDVPPGEVIQPVNEGESLNLETGEAEVPENDEEPVDETPEDDPDE